jgi:hypothetical protein
MFLKKISTLYLADGIIVAAALLSEKRDRREYRKRLFAELSNF